MRLAKEEPLCLCSMQTDRTLQKQSMKVLSQKKLDAGESNDTQVQCFLCKPKVEHKFILSHNLVLLFFLYWKQKVTKKHKPEYLKGTIYVKD